MRFSRQAENLIAFLKGLPADYSPIQRREAKGIDELIDRLRKQNKINPPRPERALMEQWSAIIGPTHASRCCPKKIINKDTLVISASNPMIRSELQFKEQSLLKAIQKIPACAKIKKILYSQ